MIWETGIKTCIISYMKRITSPGSMHNTGCLGLVHWDDPEGGYEEGGGRREEGSGWETRVYLWRIHVDIWQNQYNIVKLKNKIKNKIKSRDITLPTKVNLVKVMVFPVVMYGYESWTVKKAECRRVDAFELWCWIRLLMRVSWTARRSNQSILKEISPGCSWEGLML